MTIDRQSLSIDRLKLPSDYGRIRPDCGVVAIAVVAGVSYDRAWHAVRDARGIRRGWRGGTSIEDRAKALEALGVSFTEDKAGWDFPSCSLKDWVYSWSERDVMYMVRTPRHVQVVLNDHVTDQYGCRHISQYRSRNRRVTHVWRIDGVNVPDEQWEDIAVL